MEKSSWRRCRFGTPAHRSLFAPRFVRLLAPRRGLLEGARFGIERAVRFLRKIIRRIVRAILTCTNRDGEGAECGECDEGFHKEIRR